MNKPKGLKYLKMNITYLFPTVDMSILVMIPKLAQFLKKISALTQKIIRKIFLCLLTKVCQLQSLHNTQGQLSFCWAS